MTLVCQLHTLLRAVRGPICGRTTCCCWLWQRMWLWRPSQRWRKALACRRRTTCCSTAQIFARMTTSSSRAWCRAALRVRPLQRAGAQHAPELRLVAGTLVLAAATAPAALLLRALQVCAALLRARVRHRLSVALLRAGAEAGCARRHATRARRRRDPHLRCAALRGACSAPPVVCCAEKRPSRPQLSERFGSPVGVAFVLVTGSWNGDVGCTAGAECLLPVEHSCAVSPAVLYEPNAAEHVCTCSDQLGARCVGACAHVGFGWRR